MIVTDQQQYHTLGIVQERMPQLFLDKLKIRTPNLDWLAQSGTLFENAYCTAPVCVPSRAAMATGNSVQRTGLLYNGGQLAWNYEKMAHIRKRVESQETLGQALVSKLGYKAEYYGKVCG